MKLLLLCLGLGFVLVTVGYLLWVRMMQPDAQAWFVDPLRGAGPGGAGARLLPPEAPVFDEAPGALLQRIAAIGAGLPGAEVFEVGAGSLLIVTRTPLMKFPDAMSVTVIAVEGRATLAIDARARAAGYDWGTNAARIKALLAALDGPRAN